MEYPLPVGCSLTLTSHNVQTIPLVALCYDLWTSTSGHAFGKLYTRTRNKHNILRDFHRFNWYAQRNLWTSQWQQATLFSTYLHFTVSRFDNLAVDAWLHHIGELWEKCHRRTCRNTSTRTCFLIATLSHKFNVVWHGAFDKKKNDPWAQLSSSREILGPNTRPRGKSFFGGLRTGHERARFHRRCRTFPFQIELAENHAPGLSFSCTLWTPQITIKKSSINAFASSNTVYVFSFRYNEEGFGQTLNVRVCGVGYRGRPRKMLVYHLFVIGKTQKTPSVTTHRWIWYFQMVSQTAG